MNIFNTILQKIMPNLVKPEPANAAPSAVVNAPLASAPKVQAVDVEEILRGMESKSSQKLDWRHSIVDLMKTLNLDSDLESRKQLAKELNYSGSMSDTAQMNTWLHKQVMIKLEENGGKIPDSMKH